MRPQPGQPRGQAPAQSTPVPGRPAADLQGSQAGYRAKLNVQGRLMEIITPRPLTAGSEVRLTRDSADRIQVNVTRPAPGQSQPAASQPLPTRPGAPATPAASSTPSTPASLATPASPATPAAPAAPSSPPAPPPAPAASQSQPSSAPTTQAQGQPGAVPVRTSEQATPRLQVPLPANQPDPGLRTGESVTARVVRVNVESPPPPVRREGAAPAPPRGEAVGYRTQLALPGRTLELTLPQPLRLESQVTLRLNPGGTLTLELPSPRNQAVEQALRQHLPRQQPPHLLLNLLGEAQQGGQLRGAQPLLLNLVQLLLGRSLGSPQKADAEGVRQQLLNSGTQLENRVARGDTQALQQDHKALLLRFNQALQAGGQRELPPALGERLTRMTQEAISRVLVNQVTSLGRQSAEPGSETARTLTLDIPVLWQGQNESLKLQIERDTESGDSPEDDPERPWRVRLHFAMADLPPLGAELTLEGQRISVIWHGEQDSGVRRLLEPHLTVLQGQLETLGLEVGAIGIREQSATQAQRQPSRNPLIDIKT